MYHKIPIILLFLNVIITYSSELSTSNIHVVNNLENCTTIKVIKLKFDKNIILAEININSIKSIGYCGCKSKIISYSVSDEKKGNPTIYGKLVIKNNNMNKLILISSDKNIFYNKDNLYIHFSCSL